MPTMCTRRGLLIVLTIGLVISCSSQDKVATAVQSYLDSAQKANGFPGMTVSYSIGTAAPVHLATGFANQELNIAMKPNDIMLSGSTPKMFYAVVVMKMIRSGKLSLDDRLEKFLGARSWFSRLPNAREITVKHLLQHSSGIPEYYTYGDFLKRLVNEPDKSWTLEELIAYILDQPVKTRAGERFSYADTNYLLLGLLVEALTGKTMYSLVEKEIIGPLKLTDTRPSNARRLQGLITGYSMPRSLFGFEGATIREGLFVVNPQFELMGGGYISNTGNWLRFIRALFSGSVLDTASLRSMMQGIPANTGRDHQYGLGLQIRPSNYGLGFGHGGWFPGYLTEVEYFPSKDIAIAIQCNTDDFTKVKGQLRGHLVRILKLLVENTGQ